MAEIDRSQSVTFVWNYPNWGGAQIAFLSIVRNAPPGWHFRILLPREASSEIVGFFESYNVEIAFLNSAYDSRASEGLMAKLRRQWRRVRSEAEIYIYCRRNLSPNSVVHISLAPWQSWIVLYLLSRRFRTTATVHNSIPVGNPAWREAIWGWRLNFLLKRRRFQLFAANLDAVNGLRRYVNESLWDKITLTRDSINPVEIQGVLDAQFDRDARLAGNDIPTDRFIVLCVGQFIDRKGRWVFLDAARQALASDSSLYFVWVGPERPGGPDLERIAEYGLDGSFKFVLSSTLGARRQDILEFFRVADLFVLASFLEGLPISIIEAMALGIPTVSTNINGIPEAIIDEETGILVEPGDATALSQAMIRLRSDDVLRNRISTECRKFAVKNFDERVSASIVFDRYLNGG